VVRSSRLYVLTCLLVFAPFARGQTPTGADANLKLTRHDAIAWSLAHNPGITAAREQVAQARAGVVMAGALPDPTIAADTAGQAHALDPTSGEADDESIGVTIPFPGKNRMRRAVATADLRSAELALTQLQHEVATSAAQAYDSLLVAMQHHDDLVESKRLAAEFLDKTEERFKAGTVPRLDVLKAKVDLSAASNDLIANDRDLDTARASLNRTLGRPGGAPIDATDPLEVPDGLPPVDALQQIAAKSRPEIASLDAQLEGARAATRLASRYWQPDLDLSVERNAERGSVTTFTTYVGFGVPLFFWQHKRGEVAAAKHRESELAATIDDQRVQVSLDVASAYSSASTALRQVVFIRDELLPEAQDVYRVASKSYELGGSSALELLDAKRALVDAQSQYADALGAANDARSALELAIGAPLPKPNSGEHE